jgi:tellurite resistance protein
MRPLNTTASAHLSAPEALIYAMVTTAAADRRITKEEIGRMNSIVRDLPAFAQFDEGWFADSAQDCGKLLAKPDGVEHVLGLIAASLPRELCETAYVLAAEVAASDLHEHDAELELLSLLATKLLLDKLTCAALERAARARHQRA